jgi:hypothetical protein
MTHIFVARLTSDRHDSYVLARWQARSKSWALPIFEPTPSGYFGPVAMLLFITAAFVLSRARTVRPTSDLTGRT